MMSRPTALIFEPDGSGHRFEYVRHLVMHAGIKERFKLVVAIPNPESVRVEHDAHLASSLTAEIETTFVDGHTRLKDVIRAKRASLVIIPDGDRYVPDLVAMLRSRRERARGTQFILVVMRPPALRGIGFPSYPRQLLKTLSLVGLALIRSRFRILLLSNVAIPLPRTSAMLCRATPMMELHDPVALTLDEISDLADAAGSTDHGTYVLTIGILGRVQAIEALTQALAVSVSECELRFVGGVPAELRVDDDVHAAIDCGFLTRAQLNQAIANAREVLIFPRARSSSGVLNYCIQLGVPCTVFFDEQWQVDRARKALHGEKAMKFALLTAANIEIALHSPGLKQSIPQYRMPPGPDEWAESLVLSKSSKPWRLQRSKNEGRKGSGAMA